MLNNLGGALGDMFIGKTISGGMCSIIMLHFKSETFICNFTITGQSELPSGQTQYHVKTHLKELGMLT